ncbi:hypothetical protein MIDIC_230064 [Alphaproteobacteria bacterium]
MNIIPNFNIDRSLIPIGSDIKSVAGRFEVLLNNPLPKFTTIFADAYVVREKDNDTSDRYYALIPKNIGSCRLETVIKLYDTKIPNFLNVIAIEIVLIESIEHFVAILPIPIPFKAQSIFLFEHHTLEEGVILPIIHTLKTLHDLGVSHGSINIDTLCFDSSVDIGKVVLNNCIFGPSGLKQSILFETINRARIHPYAKSYIDFSADYYALGVLVLVLISKKEKILAEEDLYQIVKGKLLLGSYQYLTQCLLEQDSVNTYDKKMLYLAYWLLQDNPAKQWRYEQILKFIKEGCIVQNDVDLLFWEQKTNTLNVKFIEFLGEKYSSLQTLRYALSCNWEEALIFIRDNKFLKWLIAHNEVDADCLLQVTKLPTYLAQYRIEQISFSQDDVYLIYLLLILDPSAPFSFPNLSFYPDTNLPELLNFAAIYDTKIAHLLIDLLENGLIASLLRFTATLITATDSKVEILHLLSQIQKYCANDISYTEEKYYALYLLNNYLPYQHAIVDNKICFSLKEVLEAFEGLSADNFDNLSIPLSLNSFLMVKLNLGGMQHFDIFHTLIDQRENCYVKLLALFALSQQKCKVKFLPNACKNFTNSIKDIVLKTLHSVDAKQLIEALFNKSIKLGSLNLLFKIFNSRILRKDYQGYQNAMKDFKKIQRSYTFYAYYLVNKEEIQNKGKRIALKTAYIIFFTFLCFFIFTLLSAR